MIEISSARLLYVLGVAVASLFCSAPAGVDADVLPGDDGQSSDSSTVLVLGREQLLRFPDGFDAAVSEFAGRDRRTLRIETIERLRGIAAEEQSAWLRVTNGSGHQFWIINALAGRYSQAQINQLSALPNVLHVYEIDDLPPEPTKGPISLVVPPIDRGPFSLDGKTVPWNVSRIGADRVWSELGVTGEGIVVAMFDSGVDYGHEELSPNVWTNPGEVPNNGLDDDENGFVDDLYGFNFGRMTPEVRASPSNPHGTTTSGIVAGSGVGGIQTGIAPRARIMALMASGLASSIQVYEYAVANGADIINMSFSQPGLGDLRAVWRLMAEQATIAGLVSVSGAGNFRQTTRIPVQQRIPEGIPSVISVGGVDSMLTLAPFSSMGPVEWSGVRFYNDYPSLTKPDVAAFPGPGYPVIHKDGSGYLDPNNFVRGNSFSGPHASGVAALMLSADPDLPAWEVKRLMEETATEIAPAGKDNRTGAGLINAFRAVEKVVNRN